MSRSSSPLIIGDGDLIIEEVPMDEDEAAAMPPPPPSGPIGPPNACIIRPSVRPKFSVCQKY